MKALTAAVFATLFAGMAFAQDSMENPASEEADRYTVMFNEADSDKDSHLSGEEAQAIGLSGASFSSLDSDSDGKLSLEEFLALINAGQGAQ